jgi:hypothetical protein
MCEPPLHLGSFPDRTVAKRDDWWRKRWILSTQDLYNQGAPEFTSELLRVPELECPTAGWRVRQQVQILVRGLRRMEAARVGEFQIDDVVLTQVLEPDGVVAPTVGRGQEEPDAYMLRIHEPWTPDERSSDPSGVVEPIGGQISLSDRPDRTDLASLEMTGVDLLSEGGRRHAKLLSGFNERKHSRAPYRQDAIRGTTRRLAEGRRNVYDRVGVWSFSVGYKHVVFERCGRRLALSYVV